MGDVGAQVLLGSNNDQVLVPIGLITKACANKLKDQLNTFVHVVREAIEGSKMVEDLNQEEHSIVTLLQVIQQASP